MTPQQESAKKLFLHAFQCVEEIVELKTFQEFVLGRINDLLHGKFDGGKALPNSSELKKFLSQIKLGDVPHYVNGPGHPTREATMLHDWYSEAIQHAIQRSGGWHTEPIVQIKPKASTESKPSAETLHH